MKNKKIYVAISLLLVAILITAISTIAIKNGVNRAKQNIEPFLPIVSDEEFGDMWQVPPSASIEPTQTFADDTSDSVPSVGEIIKEIIPKRNTQQAIAQITIETNRKKKTYDVMQGVDEKTLKKDIGWLPSSSLPGQEGLCVLMAHRDTEFKILKYAEVGDKISISYNNKVYNYRVSKIQIIDSDEPIAFEADSNSSLVLVTCYPFYYTGSASRKCLVYAE